MNRTNKWETRPYYPKRFRPIDYIDDAIGEIATIVKTLESDDCDDETKDMYDIRFPYKTFLSWLISIRDSNLVPEELFRVYARPEIFADEIYFNIYKKIFLVYYANQISPGTRDMCQSGNGRCTDQRIDVREYYYNYMSSIPEATRLEEDDIDEVIEYSTNYDIHGVKYLLSSREYVLNTTRASQDILHSHECSVSGGFRLYDTIGFF